MSEWISVEDRLPEVGENCLTSHMDFGGCCIETYCYSFFKDGVWGNYGNEDVNVTHWQPLPPPPDNS